MEASGEAAGRGDLHTVEPGRSLGHPRRRALTASIIWTVRDERGTVGDDRTLAGSPPPKLEGPDRGTAEVSSVPA